MTAVGLVGAKGAPGVTTTAVLLAAVWPRPACLLEADPSGGDLRWWQPRADGLPLRPDTGVVSLLAAHRDARPGPAALAAHAQQIQGGLPVVVGVGSPSQHRALSPTWPALTCVVTDPAGPPAGQLDGVAQLDVVVDVGRLGTDPGTDALLAALPLVMLVCRPTVASVAHARHALAALGALPMAGAPTPTGRAGLGVVVIGTANQQAQVRTALAPVGPDTPGDAELFFGHLADDPLAAGALAGQWTRRLDRSPLIASGRRLAGELHDLLIRADSTRTGSQRTAGPGAESAPPPADDRGSAAPGGAVR